MITRKTSLALVVSIALFACAGIVGLWLTVIVSNRGSSSGDVRTNEETLATTLPCYYFDKSLNREVPSSAPIVRSYREALRDWQQLSRETGSFFGIVTSGDVAVQFYWERDNEVLIDVPLHERKGSLTRKVTFEESERILRDTFHGVAPTSSVELVFEPW